ncbi:MAG: bis(5'-nucleosyl)-tetraphosphatase (symmetrical) YqeK [Eggerthellaceae bacterium]|nr:bis(5'-nucleosyl)-tetraphosphatase (symmetrical) YqeK [Eggerthellaceae bacterium]
MPDGDVFSKAFFNERKAELEKRVSAKRFKHSLGVSYTCVQLAEEYGLDVKKARLAGLLHDWDKGYDDEGARARVRELGMEDEVDPVVVEKMPGVLHGITAARALGNEFPGIPADILQAISRHTTAALDMEPLDMVLYIADAIEPNRQFGRIDELRARVGEATLEELYFETYEYWVFLLFERRKPLHPDTIRIWNAYTERLPRKGKRGSGDGSVSGKKHKRKK